MTLSNTYSVFERANVNAMFYQRYVVKQENVFDYVNQLMKKQDEFSFSFDQYGYRLYSDYTRNKDKTRSESLALAEELAEQWKEQSVGFVQPNSYMWKYADEYFDVPMTNSQYLYETDTVPFLQMVLKGSVDYYAPFANQGGYAQNDILKMIEYGTYPSFLVIASDNYSMNNTTLEDYYSLNYYDWEETIKNVYGKVSEALQAVEGAKIIAHTVLAEGVVRVDYDNNVSIYVNYTNSPYAQDGVVVPETGYWVERS